MTLHRVVSAFIGLVLLAAIVWATATGQILQEGSAMLALPWGLVTFIDLYASFFFAASLIMLGEPNRPLGIALALSVFVLGSVVTAAWMVFRAPLLWRKLGGKRPADSLLPNG